MKPACFLLFFQGKVESVALARVPEKCRFLQKCKKPLWQQWALLNSASGEHFLDGQREGAHSPPPTWWLGRSAVEDRGWERLDQVRTAPCSLKTETRCAQTPKPHQKNSKEKGVLRKALGLAGRHEDLETMHYRPGSTSLIPTTKPSSTDYSPHWPQAQIVKLEDLQPCCLGSKANICRKSVSEDTAVNDSAIPLSTTDATPSPPNVPLRLVTKIGEFKNSFFILILSSWRSRQFLGEPGWNPLFNFGSWEKAWQYKLLVICK